MTPSDADTPLTAEEELAELRAARFLLRQFLTHEVVTTSEKRERLLDALATLDAERAAHNTSLLIEGTAVAERDRLLDATRASPAPAGLDVERLVTAFHSEFCGHGHPAAYDRPIITKVAEAYSRLSPPVDRDAACECGEPRSAGIHDPIRTWVTDPDRLHAFRPDAPDRDVPREGTTRCGNCPHDPDAHSPVGLELCSFRGCECQGLLTVAPREPA